MAKAQEGSYIFPIREYTKKELRILFANPEIDLNKPDNLRNATPMNYPRFSRLVYPIIQEKCKGIISLEKFKQMKIVPVKLVKEIFKHIESEL